jgi:hypothetical protein
VMESTAILGPVVRLNKRRFAITEHAAARLHLYR